MSGGAPQAYVGALIIRTGLGGCIILIIIRNPQNSVRNTALVGLGFGCKARAHCPDGIYGIRNYAKARE